MNSTTQFVQVHTGPKLKRQYHSSSSDSSDDDLPNIDWNKNPRLEDESEDPTTMEEWIKRKCPVIKNSGAAVDLADNIMENDTKGRFQNNINWLKPGDHPKALEALRTQMAGFFVRAPSTDKFNAGFKIWEYPHVLMIPECVDAIKAHLGLL